MEIADKVIAEISAHAAESYPHECCGLIITRGGKMAVVRSPNLAPDPYRSFLLDSVLYFNNKDSVVAVYHSHPNRAPNASEADKASCSATGLPFLIISWPAGNIVSIMPDGYVSPLEEREFVYGVFDCLGLVRDYYQQELGIEIRNFDRPPFGWWTGDFDWIAHRYERAGFVQVGEAQPGDVVVMQLGGANVPNHVGVYLEGGLLLHHSLFRLSCKQVYGGYWRKHTVRFLRHKNRCTEAC